VASINVEVIFKDDYHDISLSAGLTRNIPKKANVSEAEWVLSTPAWMMDPVHTYTPSFTICIVEFTTPTRVEVLPGLLINTLGSVDWSVLLRLVLCPFSVQEMVGSGVPVAEHEIVVIAPSLTVSTLLALELVLVLDTTVTLVSGSAALKIECKVCMHITL
jgi:hypothetical protein